MQLNNCTEKIYYKLFLKLFIGELPKLLGKIADAVSGQQWTQFQNLTNQIKLASGFCGAGPIHYTCFSILQQRDLTKALELYQSLMEQCWLLNQSIERDAKKYSSFDISVFLILIAKDYILKPYENEVICLFKDQNLLSRVKQKRGYKPKPLDKSLFFESKIYPSNQSS